ncbi:MAG: zinc-binding dehydrogenase [Rhodothalassiaceae bacterium]
MKAAVFEAIGQPLRVTERPAPAPGPRDVIIQVNWCGICGSDLHATQPGDLVVPAGTILGHEFSGTIAAVGEVAAAEWRIGERVTAVPIQACGACDGQCRLGMGIHCPNNTIIGFSPEAQGAYAGAVRVDMGNVLRLPADVDLRMGATAEPLAVGHHVIDKAAMRPGASVLVLGGGPIGLACTQFARHYGARSVLLSDFSVGRRKIALQMGADDVIDAGAGDAGAAFEARTGRRPDVILECVGVPGMLHQCIEAVAPQGKIMVCGVCTQAESFVPLTALAKEACLQWVLGYTKRDFEIVLELMAARRIDPTPMISHEIGLDDLPHRFEALRRPTDECKVLVSTA